jgi:hypothetical protein
MRTRDGSEIAESEMASLNCFAPTPSVAHVVSSGHPYRQFGPLIHTRIDAYNLYLLVRLNSPVTSTYPGFFSQTLAALGITALKDKEPKRKRVKAVRRALSARASSMSTADVPDPGEQRRHSRIKGRLTHLCLPRVTLFSIYRVDSITEVPNMC